MPENRDIERRNPDDIERRRDSLVQRSLDYLKEFEEQGLVNVEQPDLEGWDLHRAAKENRVDIARALIAALRWSQPVCRKSADATQHSGGCPWP